MEAADLFMHGFDAGETRQVTVVAADEALRERLVPVVAAIVLGATPEEIATYLEDGFPEEVASMITRPLEREELVAHVDLLVSAIKAGA